MHFVCIVPRISWHTPSPGDVTLILTTHDSRLPRATVFRTDVLTLYTQWINRLGNGDRGFDVSDRETLANELRQMIEHIRAHVPDAVINTRLAQSDQNGVVMHAQVMGGSGPSGSAHASAPVGDCSPELAENRALARAMIAMGLPPIQEAAPPRESAPAPKLHSVTGQPEQPGRVVQFPAHEPERTEPKPDQSESEPKPDQGESDPEPEDISWTAFWTWAKANGFPDKKTLEEAIGRSINQLTPAQIRKLAQSILDTR
jgi:hypothetical protein